MRRMLGLWLLGVVAPALAWATPLVQVRVDGGPQVVVNAPELAVFQPNDATVWVVAAGRGGLEVAPAAAALGAWQIERLQVSGGAGVKISGPRARVWGVEKQGSSWLVRPEAGSPPAKRLSALIVQEGVRLPGAALSVQDSAGERFMVVPSASAGLALAGVPGLPVAVRGGAVPASRWLAAVAETQPVAPRVVPARVISLAPTPTTLKLSVVREKMPGKPVREQLAPVASAQITEVDLAALEPASGGVASPTAAERDDELYVPGTVRVFSLPAGWRLDAQGKPVRDGAATERGQAALLAAGAALQGASVAEEVAEEVAQTEAPSPTGISAADVSATGLNSPTLALNQPAEAGTEQAANLANNLVDKLADLGLPEAGSATDYLPGLAAARGALLRALEAAGGQENTPEVQTARENLAAFYLAWQRPEEALSQLVQLRRSGTLPASARARVYLGMALAALERPEDALAALEKLPAPWGPDAAVWRAVALQQAGRSALALREFPAERGLLPRYPVHLRNLALVAQAQAVVAARAPAAAVKFVDELRASYDPSASAPAELTRLAGVARLGTPQAQAGLELLAEAGRSPDKGVAAQAKFDFVKALAARNELEPRQLIAYLEDLRDEWRGGLLERQILHKLGDVYAREGDTRRALARYETLVKAFPAAPEVAALPDKMTEALLDVFDPENPRDYDPLTYLGLYYDFKELLPPDERADRVGERVAGLLVQAGLPDRAIQVLEPLVQFRAPDALDKARLSLLLAQAHRQNGAPDRALAVLESAAPVLGANTVQAQAGQLEKARSLLALNQPARAAEALRGLPPTMGREEALEAAWQQQDWPAVRTLVPQLLGAMSGTLAPAQQGQVLRLAYALNQLRDAPGLLALQNQVSATAPAVADGVAALAVGVGISQTAAVERPLARVAAAVAGLNTLTDTLNQRAAEVNRAAAEQELYNKKMDYMELLPPPAL